VRYSGTVEEPSRTPADARRRRRHSGAGVRGGPRRKHSGAGVRGGPRRNRITVAAPLPPSLSLPAALCPSDRRSSECRLRIRHRCGPLLESGAGGGRRHSGRESGAGVAGTREPASAAGPGATASPWRPLSQPPSPSLPLSLRPQIVGGRMNFTSRCRVIADSQPRDRCGVGMMVWG